MSATFSPSNRVSASTKTRRSIRSRINSAVRHTTRPPYLVPPRPTPSTTSNNHHNTVLQVVREQQLLHVIGLRFSGDTRTHLAFALAATVEARRVDVMPGR